MARKLWIILSVIFLSSQIKSQLAVLHISSDSAEREYCLVYNHKLTNISSSLNSAAEYQLVNLTSSHLCNASTSYPNVRGKAVVVMRDQCEFGRKLVVAESLGASVLLIASTQSMSSPSVNESEYGKVSIPLALMRYSDFLSAQKTFSDKMKVRLYAPSVPVFDASIIALLVIAVFTVAMGGFWSGAVESEKLSAGVCASGGEQKTDSGDLTLYSPLKVVLFVLLMCGMLVLMYFFYKWLVYVIIAIFCLASATALYSCLDALLTKLGCAACSFSVRDSTCSVRSLLLGAVCVTVAVVWGVYRNEDRWIWILQDLLGIAFCLNFMKTITLSNYKICVILLSLLLVYDVFFVFITPFFTKNGESIMVQVALGPGASGEKTDGSMVEVPADPTPSYEKLPVVMRVPRFSAWAQNLCEIQFSILGYGDIIVPGLLVAYCHRFDVWMGNRKRIYFLSCTIAYFVGMIVTFAVMIASKMGQPALLYLVPFTLLTSAVVAWRRKEMKQFWAGTTYEVENLDMPAQEENVNS
ncbi:signal peptide peptidase-like 2A isoform X2 [Chanos chanos]|uniref:Signal peptide peptidase-like 2A isoform X2 n=1 Tax=Chanos chanos TaxID=29144 RepID=A0A6J2US22_CHACN|nr:signal peptide peptidase-like 2A isoform X2 [Chanos chanos]